MIKNQKKVIYISDPKLIRVLEKPVPNGIIKCFYKNPLTATEIADLNPGTYGFHVEHKLVDYDKWFAIFNKLNKLTDFTN